ncbi:spermidine synthase [Pelagibacterium sp.]|uniref:spermidine synthase n=1 Tax=Pelagibacterium sp. TaxID=1967288 RepID=UPI003A8DDE42
MKPWVHLDTANVPGGTTQLRLMQRGDEFSIMVGTNELMNSRVSGSEQALAELAAARIAGVPEPRVLIGGLGMGFTLRAALEGFSAKSEIVVAELVPEVVTWARGQLLPVFGACLDDRRVEVLTGDVGRLITTRKNHYDAVLLDVDNGPDGLSREQNDSLYQLSGLKKTLAALRPGGVLAVWSSAPNASFTRRLTQAGFAAEEVKVRARKSGRGARHVIWIATKAHQAPGQPHARFKGN